LIRSDHCGSDRRSDSFRQNFIRSDPRSEHSDRQDLLTTDNKLTCRSLTSLYWRYKILPKTIRSAIWTCQFSSFSDRQSERPV